LAMVLQLAGCHLEAQVEQLLTGILQLLLQVGHGKALEILHLHFFPPPFAGFAGAAAAFGADGALGAAPGAAFIVGAAPGAAFPPRGAGAAGPTGAAAPGARPSRPSPGFTSAGPLILISAAAFTPDLMPSVRVFMGSL